ncbi:hypothetical protein ACFLU0_01770 [Chloroflexota bacterium]
MKSIDRNTSRETMSIEYLRDYYEKHCDEINEFCKDQIKRYAYCEYYYREFGITPPKEWESEENRLAIEGEDKSGTTNVRATGMGRAGSNGSSRHKPKAIRLLASRKRLPLRPSRTKGKSLSRK